MPNPIDGDTSGSNEAPTPAGAWTHLGGGTARTGRAPVSADGLPIPPAVWEGSTDQLGRPIQFLSPGGAVAVEFGVFAVGTIDGGDHLIWFNVVSGEAIDAIPVPDAVFDSYSTPAIDMGNYAVLIASGDTLTSVCMVQRDVQWQTTLDEVVVNASPVVTTDRGPADRAFITDYSFLSVDGGKLYCINVDAFDADLNPYQPGEIVWTAPLGGPTAGNSAAYDSGWVYVATAGGPSGSPNGRVLAFGAGATTTPSPAWTFINPAPAGFFGGVTRVGGHVYASSYAFTGDDRSANTVKIDAHTGALAWSTGSNRTNAIPVVQGERVVVSGGLPDAPGLPSFGTFPTVQVFDRATGDLLWDTARDTWVDANTDGQLDPGEYLAVGGWTNQPIVLTGGLAGPRLLVGSATGGSSIDILPYDTLWELNLDWSPDGSNGPLLTGAQAGAGSSPAYAYGRVYSVGPTGLRSYRR